MQQRGTVVMQSRAGLLQPVRVDPKKRGFGTAKISRAGDKGRMSEHQGIGDTGDRPPQTTTPPPPHPHQHPHPPPHLRRGSTPQDFAARRQMQKEMHEGQAFDPGTGRGRGGPPRAMMVPLDRLPPEIARQLPQGPITLHFGHPPPHIQGGYYPPGAPKHFSSKSNEPADKARQGPGTPHAPRRGVGAVSHLAAPVRVSSSPTGVSPRDLPGGASPRTLRLSSPRALVNSPPPTARGFGEDTASPRYSSDAEKTPRSVGGRQEPGWKASPRPAEAPMGSPRGGDAGRGVPKDRGEERLLRNLNLKAVENKGGKGKPPTNAAPASEMNRPPNEEPAGRGNPHMAGGAAIYQMDRKGRGGAVGPPQNDQPGARPGPQNQQTPPPGRGPMFSPKVNQTPRAQKKPPSVLAKKSTLSPPKTPTGLSPALLIASPATSPMNSPRPSLTATRSAPSKNAAARKATNASKTSPGSSPNRVPKSPRNSPARTYVVTPKDSPTTLPEAPRRTPVRSPQATSAANVSAKLQMDSPPLQTATSATTGKEKKGRYQNPKTRLSAGGDLQAPKGRPKSGLHRAGAAEAASPPGEKVPAPPPAQTPPPRETNEARNQTREPADSNKQQLPARASPLARKLTKTSLLPVQNPSTPRSAVSQHLPEEQHAKSGIPVPKQTEGTPRKATVGEGNKKPSPAAKNRKGAVTGVAHAEGPGGREVPRAKPVRHRRGGRSKESLDVAAALPDTSGNYTSAVHQWLRQSHYKIISPQQYRQHETIQEETAKQMGGVEKAKPAAPEPEKAPQPAAPEKPGRRGRAPPVRKHKEALAIPKMAAAAAAARAGKKASKAAAAAAVAAAAAAASAEAGKKKPAAKRAAPKARGPRRRKEAARKLPAAGARLRPRAGPQGDSGDLSSSSEDTSFLSASDEGMNEQSAVC